MTSEEWRQVVSTGKESAGRRFRVRWLSLILAVGLIVLSVVTSLVGRRVVSDQEDRQVRQRTSEIASVLDGAVTNIEGNLRSLGAVFRVAPDAFDQAARDAVEAKQFAAVGVVKREGSTFRIQRAAGPGLAPGSEIVPEAVPALMQAATTPRSVWTKVFMRGDERRLGAVIAFPNQPETYGYEESVLQPPQQSAITASQPFGELIVALYSSDRPDPDQLLAATSSKVPLTDAHSEPYTAGASQWLLVVKPRGPLAGSLANGNYRPRDRHRSDPECQSNSRWGCFYVAVSLQCGGGRRLKGTSCHCHKSLNRSRCCEFTSIDSKRHGGVAQVVRAWDS